MQSIEAYKAWVEDNDIEIESLFKDIKQDTWSLNYNPNWELGRRYYRIKEVKKKKVISQFRCYHSISKNYGAVYYFENRNGVAYYNDGSKICDFDHYILIPNTDIEIEE